MSDSTFILLPVGRVVQGDLFTPQTKDMEGRPLTDGNGQPRVNYFFAVAIPKTDPHWPGIHEQIKQIAQAGFPGGQSQQQGFAWKIVDGDAPENASKEGFPGHWVVRMSSGFATKITKDISGTRQQITDPTQAKRGDYVQAYVSVRANGSAMKPGMYINHQMVDHVGYGEAITSGPSADEIFGGAAPSLPPGASATPVASGAPMAMPDAPPVPPAAPATPATPATPAASPPVPPPAPDILTPPAPPAHHMTEKAAGVTYEQFIAQGWTDVQLIAQGYMQEVPF